MLRLTIGRLFSSSLTLLFAVLFGLSITACTPKFDWRDVRGTEPAYTVLMPGKPAQLSHDIQIGQQTLTMHMTVAQIDGVSFAVGAAKLPDATKAPDTLNEIKTALLSNISGKITQEKTTVSNSHGKLFVNTDFDAVGMVNNGAASPTQSATRMVGRLVARDVWVVEVLVVGPEKMMDKDAIDTFLGSFKPD